MATADYWSDADLQALAYGGLVNEEVMQKIWDISQVPYEFMDLVGVGEPIDGTPYGWTQDARGAVDLANALVDGADATGNQAAGGTRVQNHAQISDKVITVTERAQAVDTIGRANEFAYQAGMRQRDLRQDQEAIALYPQASVADNGDDTAGKVGSFPAWLISNDDNGTSGGATGFNTSTGVVAIPTTGQGRALQTDTVKNLVESVYINNGNIDTLMTVPQITRRLNEFIIANPTEIAVATPTANVNTQSPSEMVAQGYVNVIITDFGFTLDIVPNRTQQTYDSGDATPVQVADLFLIDSGMVEYTYLIGEHTEPLAKLGTADRAQLSVQWGLRVLDEKAHAIYRHLIPTGTITDDGS